MNNMINRKVSIEHVPFFSIFADAVALYDLAECEGQSHLASRLAKSSILSTNYALEAAANCFLESLELRSDMKKKIDRFSTLEKFDFILQWHTDNNLIKGDKAFQDINRLVNLRNALVHPKPNIINTEVASELLSSESKVSIKHKASKSANGVLQTFDANDALRAIRALVHFLNKYVLEWWNVSLEISTALLVSSWNGSTTADNYMYLTDDLEIVLKHESKFRIKFIGIHGILEQLGER